MRIAHVVPGSGDAFYCENCLRDTALVKAQRILGHSVVMAPLYLPFFVDAVDGMDIVDGSPVFYGALNTYFAEKAPVWDRMPRWLRRVFDAPRLLGFAASITGSTKARGLEQMTLSMLRGEEGRQTRELDRLVAWLRDVVKPEIVHLSNALLLGLARRIKQELRVPVVCSLQDEDTWVDAMSSTGAARVWETMAERAKDIDLFFPVSGYYADLMREKLGVSASRMTVTYPGIELEGRSPSCLPDTPPVIGFLSRMSESLGLGTLVDAFIALKRDPQFRMLKLKAMGSRQGTDAAFIAQVTGRAREAGVDADIEFLPVFDKQHRAAFLASLTVLSVPAPYPQAFGTYMIEAMAAGVPVAQPHAGAYPELVAATGGGMTYDPAKPGALVGALNNLLSDPAHARDLGAHGRAAVHKNFGIAIMAARLVREYERIGGVPAT